jgi:hypothetical protein
MTRSLEKETKRVRQRQRYYDDNPATRELAAYATPEEITAVIAELTAIIRELRRAGKPSRAIYPPDLPDVLKALRSGCLPSWWPITGVPPLLDAIIARYEAARQGPPEKRN